VGLATAGVFLPLLPATPFLLLAAACFVRSSDRLHRWLLSHRWFGPYIRNYREHRAITPRAKVAIILLLWASICTTVFAVINAAAIRITLLLIAVGVTLYVLKLKTLTPDMLAEKRSFEDA